MEQHRTDLLGIFAHHKVAANLLMMMMIISGLFALDRLNIQFFPDFSLDRISVRVVWPGASSEDVEDGITNPLEQRLKTLNGLKSMTSSSVEGLCVITLELNEGSDPLLALDEARRLVDELRNLPEQAEKPEVLYLNNYEQVAKLQISGLERADELRQLARRFESELLQRGIDKVVLNGLPELEMAIEADKDVLRAVGVTVGQLGRSIDQLSLDQPAGTVGEDQGTRELRTLNQRRSEIEFMALPVQVRDNQRVELADVADVRLRPKESGVVLSQQGRPVVELLLQRTREGNSLEAAERLQGWLQETRPKLPPNVQIRVFDETWQLIEERIGLLVRNGLGGLVLVVLILYLFLTGRVAFWVAVGIPVSFLATLFVLWLSGGSINMISLFALIMALGIIVDDAIVVGEDALAHYRMGEEPLLAAEGGARRMLAPVVASSLTTIAAFLPLMMIQGIMGKLLFAIPLVIIAVILASLVESFFVLPGHLRHAFLHLPGQPGKRSLRHRLDDGFLWFRDRLFRPLVRWSLRYRAVTLSSALALLLISLGLLLGGRVQFTFFPTPEAQLINANVTFAAGTGKADVDRFLARMERALWQTEKEFGQGSLVNVATVHHGARTGKAAAGSVESGDQLGSVEVELLEPDLRSVRNDEFIRAWRQNIGSAPGIDNLVITSRRAGPPGRDLTVRLTGTDPETLKSAATDLMARLKGYQGVSEIEEDLPYGREQLLYRLTPEGEAAGLTTSALGEQLRSAFSGVLVQIYQDGPEEVEVWVRLKREQRGRVSELDSFDIQLPNGEFMPLRSVAEWRARRGFEVLRHAEGLLAVEVTADVDAAQANANQLIRELDSDMLPELADRYGISYSFEGRSANQRETLADMRKGLLLGLMMIYLVLAWVFASYGWPLVVMMAIPFGLIGALLGHYMMGLDLTILSLFGFFGLSGIVVNDSIILVSFYKLQRKAGRGVNESLEEAACQRLRAVLLTSLTTIAGLTPLLFETSIQAQFLIPMATSIAFGLAFATLLILLVIPSLLAVYEDSFEYLSGRRSVAVAGSSNPGS